MALPDMHHLIETLAFRENLIFLHHLVGLYDDNQVDCHLMSGIILLFDMIEVKL